MAWSWYWDYNANDWDWYWHDDDDDDNDDGLDPGPDNDNWTAERGERGERGESSWAGRREAEIPGEPAEGPKAKKPRTKSNWDREWRKMKEAHQAKAAAERALQKVQDELEIAKGEVMSWEEYYHARHVAFCADEEAFRRDQAAWEKEKTAWQQREEMFKQAAASNQDELARMKKKNKDELDKADSAVKAAEMAAEAAHQQLAICRADNVLEVSRLEGLLRDARKVQAMRV